MFISFEGGEGGGKSTQIGLLAQMLRDEGYAVTTTREPGATALGAKLRQLLLFQDDGPISRKAEALMFAADRAEHVDKVIRPALARGDIVLTDRYIDSSLAYQGAGNRLTDDAGSAGPGFLHDISLWAADDLMPDLTILLDLEPARGLERARGRSTADTMELRDDAFHARLRRRFLELAAEEPNRYVVIDAAQRMEAVASQIWSAVDTRLVLPATAMSLHGVAS